MLLATALLAATITVPTIAMPTEWNPLREPQVAGCAADLLSLAARQSYKTERAAFVVMRPDGTFRCQLWPESRARRASASYEGRIPDGTVAVLHTHPPDSPEPSVQDAAEAARLDVPYVVLTPSGATIVRP